MRRACREPGRPRPTSSGPRWTGSRPWPKDPDQRRAGSPNPNKARLRTPTVTYGAPIPLNSQELKVEERRQEATVRIDHLAGGCDDRGTVMLVPVDSAPAR